MIFDSCLSGIQFSFLFFSPILNGFGFKSFSLYMISGSIEIALQLSDFFSERSFIDACASLHFTEPFLSGIQLSLSLRNAFASRV